MRGLKAALVLAALAAVASLSSGQAFSQTPPLAVVVDSCGSVALPLNDPHVLYVDKVGRLCVSGPPHTSAFAVDKTTSIGTTAVQVSAADPVRRRAVRNTSAVACEIMPAATLYGTGHPLPAGGTFTFDSSGRTTAAIFVACESSSGSVSVISY